MKTLLEALNLATNYLEAKEVLQPKLNAEILFSHVLGCSRLELYLQFERILTEDTLSELRELLKRRALHEPWQYIVGEVDFLGVKLKVDKRALIPRPETEELVSDIIEHFKGQSPKSIVDLGTGSGAIILGLLHIWPQAQAVAVDQSADALALAQENAQKTGLAERILFCQSNWLELVPERDCDLIVSNPPYLTQSEWDVAEDQVRLFEPTSALISGDEGVADLLKIIDVAFDYLLPAGWLILETGIAQHSRLIEVARARGYSEIRSRKDLSQRDRFLWMQRSSK